MCNSTGVSITTINVNANNYCYEKFEIKLEHSKLN